ncbi:Uma2 family endonuclease [Synechocystis sp. LEGE 06083]|uniref:Uma2 family endonuclease n=1 Tax=Synechocystis sp. LEGE 06083 TaxID=915336 RepID=UPI001880831F|nr:Uma2 family endonuclease [Synechocystis sp. LEGE 06083]MBE9196459.1 Uma2 family endonuclease [Synechocystis sp. LEGE 06083]
MTAAKPRWTIADLEFFPDNGDRHEIIDGNLYVTRAPHWKHQKVLTRLCQALPSQDAHGRTGEVLQTPGLIFASDDNVIPDLVWISQEKLNHYADEAGHFTAAPELIVEVLSQKSQDIARDRQVKLKLYSRVGVEEYWIVDWQQQTVEIYWRSSARLELVLTLFSEDQLTSSLFPDWRLQVADIFA